MVRVRPPSKTEMEAAEEQCVTVTAADPTAISLDVEARKQHYTCKYDHVFGPDASQTEVYERIRDRILSVTEVNRAWMPSKPEPRMTSYTPSFRE